jgi:ATP-dependent Lon protease
MAEVNEASRVVPILFTSESIVLPGMVVPIELADAARAAVDAARATESGELLIAPRLDDHSSTVCWLDAGRSRRRRQRHRAAGARNGCADRRRRQRSGPAPVEVTEVTEPCTDETRSWLRTRSCCWPYLQRGAWRPSTSSTVTDLSPLADTADMRLPDAGAEAPPLNA